MLHVWIFDLSKGVVCAAPQIPLLGVAHAATQGGKGSGKHMPEPALSGPPGTPHALIPSRPESLSHSSSWGCALTHKLWGSICGRSPQLSLSPLFLLLSFFVHLAKNCLSLGLYLRLPSQEKNTCTRCTPRTGPGALLECFCNSLGLYCWSHLSPWIQFRVYWCVSPPAHKLFGYILHFALKYISRKKHSVRRSEDTACPWLLPLLSPAVPVSDLRDQIQQLVFLPTPLPATVRVWDPVLQEMF